MAASSSHRISLLLLLLPFVVFFLFLVASDAAALKGVDPAHPSLDVSLTPCDRIQVSGYPRTNLEKYAYSFRTNLTPLLNVPERLHSKIQVCVHRNASRGMCQCEKADWKNLQKGLWSSVMSPYGKQYVDVKFSGESSGSVTISVTEDLPRWRILCLVAGLVVILLAPVVSSWLPFYYTSSMAVGVFLVVLIIIFQVMKLLPTGRKNMLYLAFYGSVLGAGSFILHQFSMMVNMILVNFGLSDDMYNPVALLVIVGIVIAGAAFGFWTVRKFVISEDGDVDTSVALFVKWAMRAVAATFIFQSTLDIPMAMGAFASASLLGFLLSKTVLNRKSVVDQSHWQASSSKWRPMRGRAEFFSRPGGGMWNSPTRVPSSSGSPSNGVRHVMSPSSFYQRRPIEKEDYYSTFHKTPNRKKFSEEDYEELTIETTREAMAGLTASPGFSDWLIEHSDRLKLLPATDSDDDEFGSESDSTGEQSSWTGCFW